MSRTSAAPAAMRAAAGRRRPRPMATRMLVTGGSHLNNPFLYRHSALRSAEGFRCRHAGGRLGGGADGPSSVPAQSVKELVALIRGQCREIQLRLAGRRHDAAAHRRAVSAVARSRPRARAVHRRRSGDRLDCRRPHADLVWGDGAGRAAGEGRARCARLRVTSKTRTPRAAGRSHHGRGGLSRHRGQQLDRGGRAGGNAEGDRRHAQPR